MKNIYLDQLGAKVTRLGPNIFEDMYKCSDGKNMERVLRHHSFICSFMGILCLYRPEDNRWQEVGRNRDKKCNNAVPKPNLSHWCNTIDPVPFRYIVVYSVYLTSTFLLLYTYCTLQQLYSTYRLPFKIRYTLRSFLNYIGLWALKTLWDCCISILYFTETVMFWQIFTFCWQYWMLSP